jgi:hypothetical protein
MTQPASIVGSMRSGVSEYVDRSAGHEALLEALTRFSSLRTRALRFTIEMCFQSHTIAWQILSYLV